MTEDTSSPNQSNRQRTTAPLDDLFETLRRPPRREILTHLVEDDPVRVAKLVDEGSDGTERHRLHHNHLPKLEAAGYITWEQDGDRVHRGPHFIEAAPVVELLRSNSESLPAEWP